MLTSVMIIYLDKTNTIIRYGVNPLTSIFLLIPVTLGLSLMYCIFYGFLLLLMFLFISLVYISWELQKPVINNFNHGKSRLTIIKNSI